MNMYTVMMAAVLLLAPFMQGNSRQRKRYILLSCLIMFFVMGLRDVYALGNDSASVYIRLFREFGETSWGEIAARCENKSVAYFYLMKFLFDLTGGDYQTAYAIYFGILMIVFAWFIDNYSPNPVESFAYFWGLLFILNLSDTMRQALAMVTLLPAFDAIVRKKPIKYILLIVLAYAFHPPAIIFLPAYWIASMRVGRNYLLMLTAILVVTYLFRDNILELMLSFYDTEIHDYEMRFLANKVLIMIVIVVAALILRPPTRSRDRVYNILLQFMGIAIVLQTFASYNNTFERLANYYFQFSVVFIPLVFQRGRFRSALPKEMETAVKTLGPWAFGAFGVWRFARYIESTAWIWLPFRFYFQK